MELEIGMKVRFLVPIRGSVIRPDKTTPAGAIGEVGCHGHERYPNLVVWLPDGEWTDLDDFESDEYEIVP